MAYESIKVDIIPGAENAEVLHFSQYDNKRAFFIELFNGGDEFIPEAGMTITLECRKRDGNIVIISDPVMTDNVAEFSTTEQLTACYGDNMAEIKIVDSNDLVIGSANFIINVEKSPTCGGLTSESEIDNLTQQIEDIMQQVIGDDYYTKAQTDTLLADKADKSDTYTKAQTDTLLADKADKSDTYTKTQVDELIDDIFPTFTASGAIASFITALNKHLVSITHDAGATTITRCGINQWNEEPENGVYQTANGEPAPDANSWRSKDFIRVKPDTSYHFHKGGNQNIIVLYFYENDGTYISYQWVNANVSDDFDFTTPANCALMHFVLYNASSGYGMTYNNDISINYPVTDTLYHAYEGQTVPVAQATSLTTLSGVNNVFADSGDVTVQYKYMSM